MSKNKTSPQKCFWLCHCTSSLILAGPSLPKREALAWLWSLGSTVSATWAWTKLHVLERRVEWPELLLDVSDSMQIAGGSMAGKSHSRFSRGMSDWLQVTWLLTFRPDGGGTPSDVSIRACPWERLMRVVSRQGESQNEAFKGDGTLVPTLKDRLRGLDLEKWKELCRLGQKYDRSKECCGWVTAGQNRERQTRIGDWQPSEGRVFISLTTSSPARKAFKLVELRKTEKRK